MADIDDSLPPLAVSMGDPAGIGPDLIAMAFAGALADRRAGFVVFGDPRAIDERARRLGLILPLSEIEAGGAAPGGTLGVVPCRTAEPVVPGTLSPANGAAVLQAIDGAVRAIAGGKARGLVTAPIHKAALYETGFAHPGHTEYLGELGARLWPDAAVRPVMMLAGPDLRTVPVTIHIPLKDVAAALSADLIRETVGVVDRDLRERFAIAAPRIAVAGLNPHAGESGKLGTEDREIVAPAVEALQARGLDVRGPIPADTLFHADARAGYDVVVCMYHDQALIPAKLLAFHEAVNVTLGLPFVRTSPDHGTALELAGTGAARADSFLAALALADRLCRSPASRAAGATLAASA